MSTATAAALVEHPYADTNRRGLLRAAFGDVLLENYMAVRVAGHERFAAFPLPELVELHRWKC